MSDLLTLNCIIVLPIGELKILTLAKRWKIGTGVRWMYFSPCECAYSAADLFKELRIFTNKPANIY